MSRFDETRERVVALVEDPRQRRRAYAVLAVVLALLCAFPRPFVARAKVVPQDASSVALGSMSAGLGAQFQGLAALLGGARQPIDMYLAISRGAEVTDEVIKRLRLVGPDGYATMDRARVALSRKVDIHSLTGGVIEVEVRTYDAGQSDRLVQAYVAAIGDRIGALGRGRLESKRKIVLDRYKEASGRVVSSEAKLNDFRRRNRLAAPEAELGSALAIRAGLEARLQAKTVEVETLSQFQGPENPQLRAAQLELASLRREIALTVKPAGTAAGPNVAGLSEVSGEYFDLFRDYRFAQALYEVYSRASEEVTVEALAGEIASDVQIIEAPRLDPDRKYNVAAVALLALVILAAFFTEIYAPATGIDLRLRKRAELEP